MFKKKSNKMILALFFIIAIIWILPFLIGGSLLFYSQYQNGIRCEWIDDQHSMSSIWIDEEKEYSLSFIQGSEFCEFKRIKDDSSVKCEFFTSDVYFYKPGKELLNQNEEPMIAATWLYDEKRKELLVQVITIEENDFGLQEGMYLTFKEHT